jgi:hypothetical protein
MGASKGKPSSGPKPLPKLSDAERHERFKEMAREVKASETPEDFEKAFKRVIPSKPTERWK